MAQRVIPDPLKRRHLIEQDLDESRSLAIAEAYEAEGRTVEALQFFVKAGARARLGLVADAAVAAGDAFLLKQIADILGEDQGQARWGMLRDAAKEKGLERYAEMALRHARSGEE
jgi:hypothetical protein